MRRRAFLRASGGLTAVLAAGCASPLSESGDETTVVPADGDVSFEAEVVDDSPEESPPRVAVELANVADYEIRFTGGAAFPFTSFTSVGGDLFAIPPDVDGVSPLRDAGSIVPDERDDCWRAAAQWKVIDIAIQETLAPDESATLELDVLAAADTDACPAAGSYTFRNEILATDARNETRGDSRQEFTLQLTVERAADGRITAASGTI